MVKVLAGFDSKQRNPKRNPKGVPSKKRHTLPGKMPGSPGSRMSLAPKENHAVVASSPARKGVSASPPHLNFWGGEYVGVRLIHLVMANGVSH